jgi:cell wall-associated NlpC family hydrolase
MDRRMTPATDRVAHVSLRGVVDAPAYTAGERLQIAAPLVDLLRSPNGARERQLWLGEGFTVIDRDQGHAFGFADKDGYCGWLPEAALEDGPTPTHWIASPGSHLYPEPKAASKELAALPMGARVAVIGQAGKYAQTTQGYIPASHLLPLGQHLSDPVAVAEMFLHTPYLWGGNARAGLDCSGLVQIAHHACGIALPGDADLQETAGSVVQGEFQRGDLLFWKGHVALAVDATRLIHANGQTMSVAYEGIAEAISRIDAADGAPLRSHRRL